MDQLLIRGAGTVTFTGPDPDFQEVIQQTFECQDIIVTIGGVVMFKVDERIHCVPLDGCYVGITETEWSLTDMPPEPHYDCERCKDDPTTLHPPICPACGKRGPVQ